MRFALTLVTIALPPAALAQGGAPQPLTRAQFIAQMDSQFRQMDADKNGQLTHAEIEQYQNQAALAAAKARSRARFAELDANKNGQLSPDEFAKLTATPPAANGLPMLTQEDANRDNQVSMVEHRSATLANFDRLDTDKNGVVSLPEMKAGGVTPP